jgi:hypothetical protein
MSTSLIEILKKLDDARIHYHIGRYRSDTVDITATFVGKRLEISVFDLADRCHRTMQGSAHWF